MLNRVILLLLLVLLVLYSGCALIGDSYSYRDDPNFIDGRYERSPSEDLKHYQEDVRMKH
jgi:hypothetical protein